MMIELRKVCNIVVDAADFVAQRRREKRLPATANDTGMCQNQLKDKKSDPRKLIIQKFCVWIFLLIWIAILNETIWYVYTNLSMILKDIEILKYDT